MLLWGVPRELSLHLGCIPIQYYGKTVRYGVLEGWLVALFLIGWGGISVKSQTAAAAKSKPPSSKVARRGDPQPILPLARIA